MSKQQDRIFLSAPHMGGNEQGYIQEAFERNWIAPLGNNVNAFEEALAAYNGVAGASVLSSGTAAIHLALRQLDVGEGDVVFCSSLTFVATANPILYQGARPVFIDSEPATWNMSPGALERALGEASDAGVLPKTVIIVNLYGQSARMDRLMEICRAYGVPVIEDAAESLGSEYLGRKSGTFGDFGVYSFNGNKIITTSGGGALVSGDVGALERTRFLATQAREPALHYEHSEVGYNYRMSNIVAGVGRGQLDVLDERVAQRRGVFERYYDAFGDMPGVAFMPELEGSKSNRWLTALTVDPEKAGVSHLDIIEALSAENIEARPVWKPMHLQPLFEDAAYYEHEDGWSVSDELFRYGLCLPSSSSMTEGEQSRVIGVVERLLR
ncbi:aminotransferase class I/II-fold pyridoxal phosphate-dependent enzyme [Salicibibacter cibi]|uniref:Aminotransferase class I/II-fold pyridoxal phosphate-dependent enzyme n=1 Tax=Salicibibacter cibi TaxID=2743001 RepID=A0A7T6ZBE2_9BACI|nr:aminotransferase class I/II-fold pyridoxal phosphate-dependent enzyme [Salicibibacter cibi]QQK80408.1 aminotransferase class I/II-fold pyridoxal phosphate-dependent enzyme [Salicibibacter cibi]